MKKIHFSLFILAIACIIAFALIAILGGNKKSDLLGTWVTDTCAIQSGFQCGTQGLAASINNSTQQYNSWELHKDKLILKGKQFKDRRVYDLSDTLTIKKLSPQNLTIEQNGKTVQYKKIR